MSKSSNKNILITGSSNGLGYNLAKIFVDNGNKVFLNGLSKKNVSIRCKELNTEGMACDVTKENDCNKLIKSAEKYLGNIDVLLCNVGSGSSVPIGNETLKEWKRVFDLNFFSTVNTVNALIKNSKSKKVSIICVSSICGHEYIPGAPATYSVAKSALNNYINIYSKYIVKYNYRLNGIVCGNIMFPGSSWEKKLKGNNYSYKKKILEDVSVDRFAEPMDIYDVIWLLSKDNTFINGSLMMVDGGQTRSF